MKEAELRKHATCNPILASGLPLFWRVTIERFGIDMQAVQRQDGLGVFMGHAGIAAIMGPDEDMATPMMPPVALAVCETCAVQSELPVAVLGEIGERT